MDMNVFQQNMNSSKELLKQTSRIGQNYTTLFDFLTSEINSNRSKLDKPLLPNIENIDEEDYNFILPTVDLFFTFCKKVIMNNSLSYEPSSSSEDGSRVIKSFFENVPRYLTQKEGYFKITLGEDSTIWLKGRYSEWIFNYDDFLHTNSEWNQKLKDYFHSTVVFINTYFLFELRKAYYKKLFDDRVVATAAHVERFENEIQRLLIKKVDKDAEL